MQMRKINAGLSLIAVLLLLFHAIVNAIRMISKGAIGKIDAFLPWVLFGLVMVHAAISIYVAISAHSKTERRKCKSYPKLNVPTIIQRITGILLIIFAIQHVLGTSGLLSSPPILHAIVPAVFFTIALMHVAVSTSKAFITLGIGNAKFIKVVDIVTKVICVATLIASLIGFYL